MSVGHAIKGYALGRDDARSGIPRRREKRMDKSYQLGYSDELGRMHRERRLAQMRLWEAT